MTYQHFLNRNTHGFRFKADQGGIKLRTGVGFIFKSDQGGIKPRTGVWVYI